MAREAATRYRISKESEEPGDVRMSEDHESSVDGSALSDSARVAEIDERHTKVHDTNTRVYMSTQAIEQKKTAKNCNGAWPMVHSPGQAGNFKNSLQQPILSVAEWQNKFKRLLHTPHVGAVVPSTAFDTGRNPPLDLQTGANGHAKQGEDSLGNTINNAGWPEEQQAEECSLGWDVSHSKSNIKHDDYGLGHATGDGEFDDPSKLDMDTRQEDHGWGLSTSDGQPEKEQLTDALARWDKPLEYSSPKQAIRPNDDVRLESEWSDRGKGEDDAKEAKIRPEVSSTKQHHKGSSSTSWHSFTAKGEVDPAQFMQSLERGQIARFIGGRYKTPLKAAEASNAVEASSPAEKDSAIQPNGPPHPVGSAHIFKLTGTLPWSENIVIRSLHRVLGRDNFRLYRKAFNGYTREYFLAIDQVPLDFGQQICMISPQYRAGDKENGFEVDLEPVVEGVCEVCKMNHKGSVCSQTFPVDIDAALHSDAHQELVCFAKSCTTKEQDLLA